MAQSKGAKRAVKFAAVVFGCVVIPLMYSFFYLSAFWDPYSRLEKVPVAVVNNDSGAFINGSSRNIGEDICDELKKEKDLKFIFTDEKTATDGTKGKKYYAMISIPENFSKDIASVNSRNKKTATINYMMNEKRNYLASQILNTAINQIEKSVTSDLDKEITGTLTGKLKSLPGELETLGNGMGKMYDGAIKLQNGSKALFGGMTALGTGASKLDDGALKLISGTNQVNNGASKLAGGGKKLYSGTKSLAEGAKRADFGAKKLKNGSDSLTDGLGNIKKGVGTLSGKMQEMKSGIDSLDKALNMIDNENPGFVQGLKSYTDGVNKTYEGSKKIAEKTEATTKNINVSELSSLIKALGQYDANMPNEYKAALLDGIVNGMGGKQGIADMKKKIDSLDTGLAELNGGLKDLNSGLKTLNEKSPKINGAAQAIGKGVNVLNSNVPKFSVGVKQLSDGIDSAKDGSEALGTGLSDLSNGTGSLNAGATDLSRATQKLSLGAMDLSHGTSGLLNGSKSLKTGTENLLGGVGKLQQGGVSLNDGVSAMATGLSQGKEQVKDKVNDSKSEVKKLDGLDEYAAKPMDTKKKEYQPVANYGTAFAPYFMSLSLWVGGLIIFFAIYFDVDRRFKWLCRDSDRPLSRSFVYLLLGLAQAIILAVIVKYALGLQVNHMGAYFSSCLLVSVVFISIIQFCIVHLGDIGKFVAMLLLILQLTSCGGTFPMETVPKMFNVLYPYMPMTYSVGLFKETISGNLGGDLAKNITVLIIMLVASMVLTITFSVVKRGKTLLKDKREEANPANI